jgi:two-component system, OmpR family, phosphate regulon response regulator PhoB
MSARRILIVEDEKAIRDMIAFGLRRAGYDVR